MARIQSIALLTLFGLLSSCGQHSAIVVGAKNFTEQTILGEILAQHLEARLQVPVERRFNLGGTLIAHQALVHGQIDLYPEYTGTALMSVLKLPASRDSAKVLSQVRNQYQGQFNVEWLEPLGFDNTFALAARSADAQQAGVQSLSQAAAYAPGWRLGVGYEFEQRPDGLPAFLKTYPLHVLDKPRTMDLGLLYRALREKQVDLVAGSSTDAALASPDIKVLDDDARFFPPYQACVALSNTARSRVRGLKDALNQLAGKIDVQTMRRLNAEMDLQHRPVAEIARDFLKTLTL